MTIMTVRGEVARRARVDLQTPAEVAITEAIAAVEQLGADPSLTNAVVSLMRARGDVADYVDRQLTER